MSSATLLRHRMLLDEGTRIGVGPRALAIAPARPDISSSMPTVQERRSPTAQELARRADVCERCERALSLLLSDVRAVGGALFADGPNGLQLMAKSADETIVSELLDAAQAFADAAAQVEQDHAHAAPWRSARGDRYALIELQVPGAQGPSLVGVAALRVPADAEHQAPNAAWLSATARALQEAVELSTGRPFEAWMELA